MIANITNTTPATAGQSQSTGPATYHTPFGDVLVDHLAAPDLLAEFGGQVAVANRSANAAVQSGSTATAAVTPSTTSAATTASNTTPSTAGQSQSTGPATYHTPFGDVQVDNLTAPDLVAEFGGQAAVANRSVNAAVQTGSTASTSTATPAPSAAPTAQSVFGDNPWMQNAGGVSDYGGNWLYNPIYFASQQTAEKIASMVGGKVIQENAILGTVASPFHQNQANNMVQLPGGGIINPGLVADFYDHGYSQSFINQMIANEVRGAEQDAQTQTQGV